MPRAGGWLGLTLPQLILLVGLALTAFAAVVAVVVARRTYAVEHLSVENRALDEALERQRRVEAELRDVASALPHDLA